jgi:hypothetical protein
VVVYGSFGTAYWSAFQVSPRRMPGTGGNVVGVGVIDSQEKSGTLEHWGGGGGVEQHYKTPTIANYTQF